MSITYDDICNEYERSLDKIRTAKLELRKEIERFTREFTIALNIADEKYTHREWAAENRARPQAQHSKLEFFPTECTNTEFESMSKVVIGRDIIVSLRLIKGGSSFSTAGTITPLLLGVVQGKVTLRAEPEQFVYWIGYERFAIPKDAETGDYAKLFAYLKCTLFEMCRFN